MGVFEGALKDFNNSGQTINRYGATDKFSLCKILLPSSPPYPHTFSSTELQMLPEGIQIKERRKLSFTMVIPYSDNVDNATHVVWGYEYRNIAASAFYRVEDFKIINSAVCEISVVFDAVTTLLVNKPRLSGLVTGTVNGDTPITETYQPTHLLKERCYTFKGTGKMCMYITLKAALSDVYVQSGSDTEGGFDRGYANTTTETIYHVLLPDSGYDTIGQLLYQLVTTEVTRGGMFVQDMWFEEQPPEGVDTVVGSLELSSSTIGSIARPLILEKVTRRSTLLTESSYPIQYNKYDTINQPLTSMGIHISYGENQITIPYRNILDYLSSQDISNNFEHINFEVVYCPTSTSSSNSKLCVYVMKSNKPLVEYDIPTTSIGSVSHPFATDYFTYEARNAVAVTEEVIQTILALTFNISSLIDSKKKDYTGVADSILSFFFTNAARLASIIDNKRLPIEGGGGSMTPINTLFIDYDVTPVKAIESRTVYGYGYVDDVKQLSRYERYTRKFSCAVKVTDVAWDEGIFTNEYYNIHTHGNKTTYVQGNFIISNTSGKHSAAELHEMMNVLSDGILQVDGITL